MAKQPAKVQPGATQNLGYPINWMAQGRLGDLIRPLQGLQGLFELQKMCDRDETVGAMLFIINMVMSQVTFGHVSMQNGKVVTDNAKADAARDFADTLMWDMNRDFYEHIEEALTMIWAGFAPCEITLRQRTLENGSKFADGLYGLESCDLRDQLSVAMWVYDPVTRDFLGMRQSAMGGQFIPSWKLCNYTTTSVLKRPTGRSLLANAHRSWKLKVKIQDSEALGIDRDLAGLPTFRLPSHLIEQAGEIGDDEKPTAAALKAQQQIQSAIDAVTKMRFNEGGGLVLPSDPWSAAGEDVDSEVPQYDFKITTTAGQRSIDPRNAARDYDRAIARLLAMQFMHLGDRSSGSYGLSDDQSEMFLRAIMALGWKIGRTWTRSVLSLVWEANGMDTQYIPQLQPQPFTKDALNSIGIYLQGLSKIMPMIEDDAQARTEALALGGITADPKFQKAPIPIAPQSPPQAGGDPDAEDIPPEPKPPAAGRRKVLK